MGHAAPRPQLTPPPLGCATGGARRGACGCEQRRGRGSGRVRGGASAGGGRREPHAGHPPLQLPGLVSGFVSGFVRSLASCAASCAASSAASGVASRGLLLPGSRRSVESRGVGAPCAEGGAWREALGAGRGLCASCCRAASRPWPTGNATASCAASTHEASCLEAAARGAPCGLGQRAWAGAARAAIDPNCIREWV